MVIAVVIVQRRRRAEGEICATAFWRNLHQVHGHGHNSKSPPNE
jgi:hypothetical protein